MNYTALRYIKLTEGTTTFFKVQKRIFGIWITVFDFSEYKLKNPKKQYLIL